MERIVVGVDGSENGRAALEWALDEARRREANVDAVYVWHAPYADTYPLASKPADTEAMEAAARQTLDEAVAAVGNRGPGVEVRSLLVAGSPSSALVERAKGAELLVVGSRGLGGVAGAVLGSVSHQVVHHAPCPVVVVPHAEPTEA